MGTGGHDSLEDALATRELAWWYANNPDKRKPDKVPMNRGWEMKESKASDAQWEDFKGCEPSHSGGGGDTIEDSKATKVNANDSDDSIDQEDGGVSLSIVW